MQPAVLVIDDDPSFLRLLEHELTTEGFQVFTATTGSQGMELLKGRPVSLVVTDMRMPFVDGFDVIYALKEQYPTLPILLTTASPVNERVRKALRFESVAFLSKPFQLPQFREAVASLSIRPAGLPIHRAA